MPRNTNTNATPTDAPVPVVTIDDVAISVDTLTTDDILGIDLSKLTKPDAAKLAQRLVDIDAERKAAQIEAARKAVETRRNREQRAAQQRAALLALASDTE